MNRLATFVLGLIALTQVSGLAAELVTAPIERAGKYGVLFKINEDKVGEPVVVTAWVDGVQIATKTHIVGFDYENTDAGGAASVAGNAVLLEVGQQYVGRTMKVVVDYSTGTQAEIAGVKVAAPHPEFGVPIKAWDAVHSGPTSCRYKGKLYKLATSVDGSFYASYDGVPLGERFAEIPEADRDRWDIYHTGFCVVAVDGGIAEFAVYHNTKLYFQWRATPFSAPAAPPLIIQNGPSTTYVRAAAESPSSNRVIATCRANSVQEHLIDITNPSSATPTVVADVLIDASMRAYPGTLEITRDSSDELVAVSHTQTRFVTVPNAWGDVSHVIYNLSTRQARSFTGVNVGGTALGTAGSPKLTQASVITTGSCVSLARKGSSANRYARGEIASKAMAGGKFAVAYVFVDSDSVSDAFVPQCSVRLCYHNGTTRYLTSAASNIFDLDDADSFRFTGGCRFKPGDPDTLEIAIGMIEAGEEPAEALDPYMWFGASKRIRFYEADVSSIASDADLEAAITFVGETYVDQTSKTARIRAIGGDDGWHLEYVDQQADETLGTMRQHWLGTTPPTGPQPTAVEIAAAMRAELATELGRIDQALSDPVAINMSQATPGSSTIGAQLDASVTVDTAAIATAVVTDSRLPNVIATAKPDGALPEDADLYDAATFTRAAADAINAKLPNDSATRIATLPTAGTVATTADIATESADGLLTTTLATVVSQREFTLTAAAPNDQAYRYLRAIIKSTGSPAEETVVTVGSYTAATKTIKLLDDPAFTVSTGDTITVLAQEGLARTDLLDVSVKPHPSQVWRMKRIGSRVGTKHTITKQPSESLRVYAELGSMLGSDEQLGSVAQASVTISPSTPDSEVTVVADSFGTSGTLIWFTLTGGVDGSDYKVQLSCETSAGRPMVVDGPLSVRD